MAKITSSATFTSATPSAASATPASEDERQPEEDADSGDDFTLEPFDSSTALPLDIEEIIQARRTLQGSCAELAVQNAAPQHFARLEAALRRQQDPKASDEAFCQADVAFHRALVDATDNGMLRFVMYTVIEALIPVTNMVVTVVRERGDIISLHRQMLAQLRQRDSVALRGSIDSLMDYLLREFEQASAG